MERLPPDYTSLGGRPQLEALPVTDSDSSPEKSVPKRREDTEQPSSASLPLKASSTFAAFFNKSKPHAIGEELKRLQVRVPPKTAPSYEPQRTVEKENAAKSESPALRKSPIQASAHIVIEDDTDTDTDTDTETEIEIEQKHVRNNKLEKTSFRPRGSVILSDDEDEDEDAIALPKAPLPSSPSKTGFSGEHAPALKTLPASIQKDLEGFDASLIERLQHHLQQAQTKPTEESTILFRVHLKLSLIAANEVKNTQQSASKRTKTTASKSRVGPMYLRMKPDDTFGFMRQKLGPLLRISPAELILVHGSTQLFASTRPQNIGMHGVTGKAEDINLAYDITAYHRTVWDTERSQDAQSRAQVIESLKVLKEAEPSTIEPSDEDHEDFGILELAQTQGPITGSVPMLCLCVRDKEGSTVKISVPASGTVESVIAAASALNGSRLFFDGALLKPAALLSTLDLEDNDLLDLRP